MARILKILFLIGALGMIGCGHPSMEVMFNTSTEAYPVVSGSELESLNDDPGSLPITSVVRIDMGGVGEDNMKSIWLQTLTLRAKEGDLLFVQKARCYVVPRDQTGVSPVLLGEAARSAVSEDGSNVKFEVRSDTDLNGILKAPFRILVEIYGDAPTTKTSVFGELTFKARVEI